MKQKINPKIYLISSVSCAALVYIIVFFVNFCLLKEYWLPFAIIWILSIVLFFKWLPNFSALGFSILFIYAFLPIYLFNVVREREIKKGGIIVPARITDISYGQYRGPVLYYVHLSDSISKTTFSTDISRYAAKPKKVGDTILVKYAISCPLHSKIYKSSPTKEEIERFLNEMPSVEQH